MLTLILLCIISVALNIAIIPLCKTTYRSEDVERIAMSNLKVKSETANFVPANWITSAFFLIIAATQYKKLDVVAILIGMQCITSFIFCLIALLRRNSYYAIDDERLTYVRNGKEEWSHTWNEINKAHRRVISTGKTFAVYYDIETKDGMKSRSLPSMLGKDLELRVPMERNIKSGIIHLLIIIIVLLTFFAMVGFLTE